MVPRRSAPVRFRLLRSPCPPSWLSTSPAPCHPSSMSTAAPKSLLIIDEGSLVHNRDFIVRLERQHKLSVFVRRRGRTELQGRLSFAAREAVLFLRLLVSPWAYRRRAVLLCSSGHYAALAAARIGALGGNGPA